MGYWDNQGATPQKVTWKNPTVTQESQRQSGGWYYNPGSGSVERWWAGSPQSTGGGGGSSNSGGGGSSQSQSSIDYAKIIAQQQAEAADARRISQEQNNMAISGLQSQTPKIGQIFQGKMDYLTSQLDPVKTRYDNLLASLMNRQSSEEETSKLNYMKEMAKRGISQASGAFTSGLEGVLNPIKRGYSDLLASTNFERESSMKSIQDAIAQLGGQQTESEVNLASLIASAQQGYGQQAATQWGQNWNNITNWADLLQKNTVNDLNKRAKEFEMSVAEQKLPYELATLEKNSKKGNTTDTALTYLNNLIQNGGNFDYLNGGMTEQKPSSVKIIDRPSVKLLG